MDLDSPDDTRKTVTRYSRTGQTESLPQLNVARTWPSCGSYLTDEGDNVRFILNISKYRIIVMQVLLVTGGGHVILQDVGRLDRRLGRYDYHWISEDSTEVLEDKAGTWRLTSPLPSGGTLLRAASVENNIFVFGENLLYYIEM